MIPRSVVRLFGALALATFLVALPPGEAANVQAERIKPPSPRSSTASHPQPDASSSRETPEVAGEIFGTPVSVNNYAFAKRVVLMFPQPWGAADLPTSEHERVIWDSLILSFAAFQRGIEATDEEVDEMINELLKGHQRPFTRRSDPEAYRRWVVETLYQDVPLLENQVRYLIQIRKFKDQVLDEQHVVVSDDDLRQLFLDEKNHVGGEMVTFATQQDAQAFYEQAKTPEQWERMKTSGRQQVKPVSLMTVAAYKDLWSIPAEQIEAFHAMELGAIGPPMPFGAHWCVYRLLQKRTGDLQEFPAQRETYAKRVELKNKLEARTRWLKQFVQSAHLRVFLPIPPAPPPPAGDPS